MRTVRRSNMREYIVILYSRVFEDAQYSCALCVYTYMYKTRLDVFFTRQRRLLLSRIYAFTSLADISACALGMRRFFLKPSGETLEAACKIYLPKPLRAARGYHLAIVNSYGSAANAAQK